MWQAGFIFPTELRNHAVAHIAQVGGALRHYSPGGFKHGDEFIGCTDHCVFSVVSTGNIFLYCLVPAAVFGHSRGSDEHFFSVAVSIFRTRSQPVGDDFGGLLEALEFAVACIFSN
jgi:hypothetical protein